MSATLLTDRSTSSSVDTGYLAPVVPIRRSAPVAPDRPVRRPSAAPVTRRAGSRGSRYVHGSPTADWHLSRRGELLLRRVTAVITAVVVILVLTAAAFALTRAAGASPIQTRTVVIRPGQSLWQVAAATSPGADVSETTDEIRSLNHLGGTSLTPGQTLLVPVAH
jgi:LysM domain